MEGKKILYLVICGLVAVVLICVLLAGMIDGYWPWQNNAADDQDYTGTGIAATTTESTQTEDAQGTEDTNVTTEETTESTKTTENEQDSVQRPNNQNDTDVEISLGDKDDDEDGSFGVIDFDDLQAGIFPTEPTTKPTKPTTKPTTTPTTAPTTAPTEPTTKPTTKPEEPTTKPTESQGGGAVIEDSDLEYEFD